MIAIKLLSDTAAYKFGGKGPKSNNAFVAFPTVEEPKAAIAKAHGKRPKFVEWEAERAESKAAKPPPMQPCRPRPVERGGNGWLRVLPSPSPQSSN